MTRQPDPHSVSARAAGEDAPDVDPAALDRAIAGDPAVAADHRRQQKTLDWLQAAPLPATRISPEWLAEVRQQAGENAGAPVGRFPHAAQWLGGVAAAIVLVVTLAVMVEGPNPPQHGGTATVTNEPFVRPLPAPGCAVGPDAVPGNRTPGHFPGNVPVPGNAPANVGPAGTDPPGGPTGPAGLQMHPRLHALARLPAPRALTGADTATVDGGDPVALPDTLPDTDWTPLVPGPGALAGYRALVPWQTHHPGGARDDPLWLAWQGPSGVVVIVQSPADRPVAAGDFPPGWVTRAQRIGDLRVVAAAPQVDGDALVTLLAGLVPTG